MRYAYPLMLDLADRPVVIIGGGAVAARKAAGVLEAGAKPVKVVSPEFGERMPVGVERVVARYEAKHLEGAALVFAATDSAEVNEAIVRDCRARGVWVNRADADDENPGDFSTPAKWSEGNLVVTVSAGGNPALAAAIRDWIGGNLPRGMVGMVNAMEQLRPRVLRSGLGIEQRRAIFRELATEEAGTVLEGGGVEGLLKWIAGRHPGLKVED